jgi:hypothetical protein
VEVVAVMLRTKRDLVGLDHLLDLMAMTKMTILQPSDLVNL